MANLKILHLKVPCTNCNQAVTIDVPEPDPIVQKESCRCGITTETRQARCIATAVIGVIFSVAAGLTVGTVLTNYFESQRYLADIQKYIEKSKLLEKEAEAQKAMADHQRVEAEKSRSELERYKGNMTELIRKVIVEETKKEVPK